MLTMIRIFDIFFSSLGLILLLPLFFPVVIILRFSGEGEVFFSQSRVGKSGKMFDLLKFATMLKDSPNIGTGTVTIQHDPRILPIGHMLRKTKVNELPQLLNVLLGHMSIIGPRPQDLRCFEAFPKPSQEQIIKVRPGLSGIGSIVFRDEENIIGGILDSEFFYDEVIMPYKGKLEEWFVSNDNVLVYFLCIFLTIWIILRPKTKLFWRVFKDLPQPPKELVTKLGL